MRTAVAGVGEGPGGAVHRKLGQGSLRCVRGNIGFAMERRTVV
jgi:hypothetical protein